MRIESWTPALAPRDRALVTAIEARRGGALLNLDRMLLWSEPLARGWNVYLRALRQEISLPPFLRELAICVVARLTGADYRVSSPRARAEEGRSQRFSAVSAG